MKETLICTLNKHHIYYLNDANCGFYIFLPYKDYDTTNISVRLKSNYPMYDFNKHPIDVVIGELINYYKNIDNYNITLILPIFYDDILTRIRTIDDMEIYQKIDIYLGNIFNSAYYFLTKNNIKVNTNIYIINNDSFRRFTNWFVAKYNNRIEYKTILELVKQSDNFNNYNLIKTPNINFVVSRNDIPDLVKTAEIEVETFDNYAKSINSSKLSEENKLLEDKNNSGFVSYILLGTLTFIVSLIILLILVK